MVKSIKILILGGTRRCIHSGRGDETDGHIVAFRHDKPVECLDLLQLRKENNLLIIHFIYRLSVMAYLATTWNATADSQLSGKLIDKSYYQR